MMIESKFNEIQMDFEKKKYSQRPLVADRF